ncbi:helix-turn-helix domain-containing protein [Amycolatopsis roodepoortensis]|uniref:helix-turn-helix transcriptional regulator n=1 Tax=Amycolatopsis roodepoortensis TaxID=700274 RepID=UPI00214C90A2|nr:helix-turn-helix transcriptional regulator [Amycolatopsis roodepoortensis]UUV28481.1 helix-turn-helix domain-containing protein [Amycolatopsis roodepoortensis]
MTSGEVEKFGTWLARQLRRTGMTQASLAERLDITRAAVSAWINHRAEPREEMKRKIAAQLGTDPSALFNLSADVAAELPRRWQHRPGHTDGGREYGNAAAFAFDADLAGLAREATQNSLDERYDKKKPVRVHFTFHELTGAYLDAFKQAIQWDSLEAHFSEAAKADQKVSRSLKAALANLEETRSLILLRVDDYNASGLTGPEYDDGRYAAVVRRQLDSHKHTGGRAGGSYGLGKATLWAASRFGMVFMNSTLSQPWEGRTERRVVGRLDLPWREVGGVPYAGPAWFGEPETETKYPGVSRSWWADERTLSDLHLTRVGSDPGTSFLVVGAHDASGSAETLGEMREKLIHSLEDNFWAAMVGGRTEVPLLEAQVTTLRNGHIDKPDHRVDPRERHPALTRALRAYLDDDTVAELTTAGQVAKAEVPLVVTPLKGGKGKGVTHNAVLLLTHTDEEDKPLNHVVLMRGNRMSITDHRPRELPLGASPFRAVLLAGYATRERGEDVQLAEEFLRASEPPEHNKWDRTEELTSLYARGARLRLKEFHTEIDEVVRRLVGRRESNSDEGPSSLLELLQLDGSGSPGNRRAPGTAAIDKVDARIDDNGAWNVRVTLKLPDAQDLWQLAPVAKFAVRSGGRPIVEWMSLHPVDRCRVEDDCVLVDPGVRAATFEGVTDPATHPVKGNLARLVIDLQKPRGGVA